MIPRVSLKDFERDIINRQRNIVFPDTVLNQGRFYRNLASGKAVFTWGQRLSLLGIVGFFIPVLFIDYAGILGELLAGHPAPATPATGRFLAPSVVSLIPVLATSILSLVWLLLWIFLAIKVVFPDSQPKRRRRRRRGYRQSSIQ
jgi:hypothetical protein